jgi:hypothetical protein
MPAQARPDPAGDRLGRIVGGALSGVDGLPGNTGWNVSSMSRTYRGRPQPQFGWDRLPRSPAQPIALWAHVAHHEGMMDGGFEPRGVSASCHRREGAPCCQERADVHRPHAVMRTTRRP